MKKILAFVLSICIFITVFTVIPMQAYAVPYDGYPYVFENFEKGNIKNFTGANATLSFIEEGAGGSMGAMRVKMTGVEYCDVSYPCATPPATSGKIRFSAWIKLLDEISIDRMSFILYGKVNVRKTDETVEGPDVKTVTGWHQVAISNKGLKVGEWVKISYDANWNGTLGCNPGVGYENVTEANKNQSTYISDIIEMDRFSIRVGNMGGLKDAVNTEATSVSYEIDDITYEFAPAETEQINIGKNIVQNGEFDENYDGWSIPGEKEIVQDGTAPDGSKGYLKISNKDGAAITFNIEKRMTWQANHLYKVSYWAKMFDTTQNTTEGGTWLLQLANERIIDENGLDVTYPGVEKPKTLTIDGDWVKYEYYFINEYKTYTERELRTWLRIFPQGKQHEDNVSTFGLDSFKIIDLGPISNGDMEEGAADNVYFTSTSGLKTQSVLGWNTSGVTVEQSDDISAESAGEKSMKVTVNDDGGYAYKGISMMGGKRYQISFRAKGENLEHDVPIAMVLDRKVETEGSNDIYTVPDYEYYTGSGTPSHEYTNADTQEWKLSNEWQTYTCTISNKFPLKEGKSATNLIFPRLPYMYFIVDGDNKAGTTYYIDDITIEGLPEEDITVPKVTKASIVGEVIPGKEVSVNYTFSGAGASEDKSFVRMMAETEKGEYASLASFSAKESVIVPESAIGKKVVFEIIPMDSDYNYGNAVYLEAEDPGEWTVLYYDRKKETARAYSSSDKDGELVVAVYKEGRLIKVESAPVSVKALEKCSVPTENINHKEGDVLKVMLFDSFANAKPICEPLVIDETADPIETNIYLLGDSVCADYVPTNYWQQGWGYCFPNVVKDNLIVYNRGKGGKSSKTYIQEGLWDGVKAEIQPGDYVIINFGLNDIHSTVVTDTSDGRGTTIADYKMYLAQYCDETIALGATPILMSTIAEMSDSYGTLQNRSKAVKEVAEEKGVTFIDLNTYMNNLLLFDENGQLDKEKRQNSFDTYYLSAVAFERIEAEFKCTVPQSTWDYIAKTPDRTHINIYGARLVAESIAELIKESDNYLKNYMK